MQPAMLVSNGNVAFDASNTERLASVSVIPKHSSESMIGCGVFGLGTSLDTAASAVVPAVIPTCKSMDAFNFFASKWACNALRMRTNSAEYPDDEGGGDADGREVPMVVIAELCGCPALLPRTDAPCKCAPTGSADCRAASPRFATDEVLPGVLCDREVAAVVRFACKMARIRSS